MMMIENQGQSYRSHCQACPEAWTLNPEGRLADLLPCLGAWLRPCPCLRSLVRETVMEGRRVEAARKDFLCVWCNCPGRVRTMSKGGQWTGTIQKG